MNGCLSHRMPNPNQSIEFAFPIDRSWVWGIVFWSTHVCWSFNGSFCEHCRSDPFMQLNRILCGAIAMSENALIETTGDVHPVADHQAWLVDFT